MLTLDSPVFVRVAVCVCCVPTVTLPNPSLLGLRVSSPGGAPVPVPVPTRSKVAVPFDASLVMVAVALKDATPLGANEMLMRVLCPAATVSGRLVGAREKYWLEIAMPEMVTVASPEFVTVADKNLLLPAATPPKSRVDVDSESVPDCCLLSDPPTLKPWQPASKMSAAERTTTCAAFEGCFAETAFAVSFRIVSRRPIARRFHDCLRPGGWASNEPDGADEMSVDARGTPREWTEGQ